MHVLIAHKKILCDSRSHGLSGGGSIEMPLNEVKESVGRSFPMSFSASLTSHATPQQGRE
jgi:hypothetical protein